MLNVVSDPKSTVETYGATLVGNSTVLSVRNQMRAMIMGDSSSPAGGITALRDLGISIDRTGVLQLDAAKLDVALTTKFDSVVTMLSSNRENQSTFSTLSAGVAGDSVKKLTALLDATGSLTTQNTNAAAKISAYNKELAKLETRLATILARYNKQLTAMDSIVGQTNSMRTGLTATFDGMMAAYTNK
jgi:flagellar hook-associated protein 2